MADKKNYCGNGKTISGQYGDFEAISIDMDAAKSIPLKKGRYLNVIVAKRKEKDNYGNDLTVYENTFEPKPKNEEPEERLPQPEDYETKGLNPPGSENEDLPF